MTLFWLGLITGQLITLLLSLLITGAHHENTQTYRTIILYESEEHRAIAEVYPNGSGYVKWQGKTNGEWINRLTEAKDATGMKKTIDKAETCPQL